MPNQGKFRSASLSYHREDWLLITQDPFVLQAISGVKIPLGRNPPTRCPTQKELNHRSEDPVLEKSISELLSLGAVTEVAVDSEAFISRVFTVPKVERGIEYGRRFILNLKVSNLLPTSGEPYK